MSDDSSSEENDYLKEAVDPTFFSNELFRPTPDTDDIKEKSAKLPPSRRNQQNPATHFNPLQIRTTPTFRSYVSRHLHKLLDNEIDYTEMFQVNKGRKLKCKTEKKGVKLLRTSNNFLQNSQENDIFQKTKHVKKKTKKVRNNSSSSSSDEEKRAKEVAISADWILSGKATEGWAPCTKSIVEFAIATSTKK